MNLNLPIVQPNKEEKKPSGQQKITDTFSGGKAGTNVQHCVDEYTCAEEL